MRNYLVYAAFIAVLISTSLAQVKETILEGKCITCHKEMTLGLYQQWRNSAHALHGVTCYNCHQAKKSDADGFMHEGAFIATLVTPKDCSQCHPGEAEEAMKPTAEGVAEYPEIP